MAEDEVAASGRRLEEEGRTEARTGSVLGVEGELTCLVIFSDKKHVEYIYPLLSSIESVLRGRGFKPVRLGEEIRSGEDYLSKLEKLIEDCVLGVVIFDGLRPNVLFEFGFLKGKNKPVILLQSKDAFISVRTLYSPSKISGLGERAFDKLKNPPITLPLDFSDFAGKHVARIDWKGREDDPHHPSRIMKSELKKNQDAIIEEARTVKTRNMPKLETARLGEFLKPLMSIIRFYTGATDFNVDEFKIAYDSMVTISKKYGFQLPYDLYGVTAATCLSQAKETVWRNTEESIDCFGLAVSIYQEALKSLSVEKNPTEYGDAQKKSGDVYWELSQYRAKKENCKKAVKAYDEALKVYTIERFPMDYAMTQNNLGTAYRTLADVESKAENCKKAVKAYDEALKVYTKEEFPEINQVVQRNLRILIEFCGSG